MRQGAARSGSAPVAGQPAAGKWVVLGTVGLGTYLSVVDSTIVNVSLPVITRELRTDVTTVQWVVMAYLVTVTGLLLTFGRLADLIGRKPVYVAGMAVVTVGTALCGLAQSVEQLIALRVVQGVGSAMIMAIGPALTASAFSPSERGKALGINATIVALGGISGPILGGALVDLLDWRWVFLSRAPFCLLATLLAARVLTGPRPTGARGFDPVGAALLFGWLTALTVGLNQGRNLGWSSPVTAALFVAAAAGLAAFILVESRTGSPMLDLAIFRNRLFSAASASSLISFMSSFSVSFLMPFYLVQALGYAPSQAGLMLLPMPIAMSVVAPFSGWLSDRIGSRLLSTTGLGVVCLVLLSMVGLEVVAAPLAVTLRLAALGVGIGLFNSPNNSALISSVPPARMGIASGMLASMRNLGMALGTAVAGAVWTGRMAYHAEQLARSGGLSADALRVQALVGGLRDAFLVAAAICAVGVVTSLVRGSRRPLSRPPAGAAG